MVPHTLYERNKEEEVAIHHLGKFWLTCQDKKQRRAGLLDSNRVERTKMLQRASQRGISRGNGTLVNKSGLGGSHSTLMGHLIPRMVLI